MYLCICSGVTHAQARKAIEKGVVSLAGLQNRLGVAINCGSCAGRAEAMIEQIQSSDRRNYSLAGAVRPFVPASSPL